MRRFCAVALALLFLTPLHEGAIAQETGGSPLLRMLSFIPDTPEFRQYIIYGDQAAWLESWNIPRVDSVVQLKNMDARQRGYWLYVMPRQAVPPDTLGFQNLFVDDNRGVYGFDLLNVDRYLLAGFPPGAITVVEFGFDRQQIADALTATGYEAAALDGGGTLYSILGDYEVDLRMEKVRTRTGQMGNLNRIALLDGQLIFARAAEIVSGALQAHRGLTASLADNPAYRAAAAALEAPALAGTGELVGALLVDSASWLSMGAQLALDPRLSPEERDTAAARLREAYLDPYPLPPYDPAVFATRHTEGATYLILALVLRGGADAQTAADALTGRVENYTSFYTRQPLIDMLNQRGARIAASLGVEAAGLPVALLVIRNDDPPAAFIPGNLRTEQEGSIPFNWIDLVLSQDVGFLAVAP